MIRWKNLDETAIIIPDPAPRSYQSGYSFRGYWLPRELIEKMDVVRQKMKHDLPEIAVYPSWFVEAAIRHFLVSLPNLLNETG